LESLVFFGCKFTKNKIKSQNFWHHKIGEKKKKKKENLTLVVSPPWTSSSSRLNPGTWLLPVQERHVQITNSSHETGLAREEKKGKQSSRLVELSKPTLVATSRNFLFFLSFLFLGTNTYLNVLFFFLVFLRPSPYILGKGQHLQRCLVCDPG
jgi:hypothetical protein